jgi:16S rRNA (cytidine1402-2'-O)-methyltransferase
VSSPGRLYIVATPIGNLEDLTRRAARVLGEVDLIAAEDTRQTRKLLAHLGLSKPLLSYYEPREEQALPKILALLQDGKSVALVTDGGTPAVSDPGYRLVRAALDAGIKVEPVPGPSALTAALSASGLPTDRVTFAGFLPPKTAARRAALAELADRRDTLVFFESPHRLPDFLADALATLGDREAVIFREITKAFEEQQRGTLSALPARFSGREIKGEITVVIRGAEARGKLSEEEVEAMLEQALAAADRPLSALAADVARATGWTRSEVYALALRLQSGGSRRQRD